MRFCGAIESSFTLGIVVDGVQEACPGANLDMWKYRRSRRISCSFAGRPVRAVSRRTDMMGATSWAASEEKGSKSQS